MNAKDNPDKRDPPMHKRIERLDAHGFDWVLLRSFLAIYRSGTIAAAARQLTQQQSTLSRHLAELEAQLAEPLFERTGRGLHATDAAHIVARYAQEMENLAHQMALSLTAKSKALSGTVRVSASHIFASHLLPAIAAELTRHHPGLEIEIFASDDVPSVLHRATDIALRFSQPKDLNVVARKIGTVPIAAIAHECYLQAMGTPQVPTDLLHHILLNVDKNTVVAATLQELGVAVTPAHFRVRTDDKNVYVKLIEAGAGIGFVAKLLLDTHPRLIQVLPEMRLPTLDCWLTTHTEISNTPLIRVVFDAIAQQISSRLAAGAGMP